MRKQCTTQFKAQVVQEILKEEKTLIGGPTMIGVPVRLYSGALLVGEIRTDAHGRFGLASLMPGRYRVVETNLVGMFSSTPDEVGVDVRAGDSVQIGFGDWAGHPLWLPLVLR